MRVRPASSRAAGLVTVGVILWAAVPLGHAGETHQLTEVLVVGTIHDRHWSSGNYSYEHVARILDTFMRAFEKKYGDFDRHSSLGYRFWNGDEYAQYFAESYRLDVEVYGDSPFNLHYVSRNAHMMELIWAAIARNPGRRIAVLTGSEHKHVFDRELAGSGNVRVVSFESILPLSERPLSQAMQAFVDGDDDLLYYEDGAIKDLDEYLSAKLVPLVHSYDMDSKPEIVPERNVTVAERIVERWQRMSPSSDARRFEEAWLHFLRRDYRRAIAVFAAVAAQIEAGSVTKPFYRSETFVNIGRSYDVLGDRGKALSAYRRAETLLRQEGREAEVKYMQEYLVRPYQRPGGGVP